MNILEFILDLFAPKQNLNFTSIHNYLTQAEIASQSSFFKVLDKTQKPYLESIFVAANLENAIISDLINRSKFGLEYAIAKDFAMLVLHKTKDTESIPMPDLILSVPPDPNRKLKRGYYLPELVAKKISQKLAVLYGQVVEKPKSTIQQTLLNRKDRLTNLKNQFRLIDPQPINLANHTNVWLIDDITTTGTTLAETAKVIKTQAPFLKIYCLVIASNLD
jgi:ComF family protein